MSAIQDLRNELDAATDTLSRRLASTSDSAEAKAIERAINALSDQRSALNQATLLGAANVVADAAAQLERAVAAVKTGPFDGYLSALENHLQNLGELSARMHGEEALPAAVAAPAPARAASAADAAPAPARGLEPPKASRKFSELAAEYEAYYAACKVRPEHKENVSYYAKRMKQGQAAYEQVAADVGNGMPWQMIGVTHGLECGFNFSSHLHNGDPLSAKTVHVPKGRPKGTPPFTWRESAIDALTFQGLDKIDTWSIPRVLFELEAYNGFGYRTRGLATPYLWSFSNLYTKGKFTMDGKFDPQAVSKQCGAALILKATMS